ncbi:MAG TPA: energy transducer TonB [Pyrinomonadaceae bacterium]|jgi:hypothetical protein
MKKILFAALSIALFLTAVYSQNETQKGDWQRFAPAQEEFSIEFPQAATNESIFEDKGVLKYGVYKTLFNQTYFFVLSGEKKFTLPAALKQFMRAYQPKESTEKIGSLSGAAYSFRDDEDFYHRILEIKVINRSYIFHTISKTENDDAIKRFFDSIRFTDSIRFIAKPDEKPKSQAGENVPDAANKMVVPNGIGAGSGSGTGFGSGQGNGGGISSNTIPAPILPNQTSGVKVLSAQRANYTDLARTYGITGTVRLRVTFLADGQIGATTPVTRLPLGLTKNAIEAAQRIRFEPAVRDGKVYSVTKVVEYNFTLY